MASIINATTTTGVAVTGDNSGALALQTNNGTTAVTIDTSQNVGIGETSPAGSAGYTQLVVRGSSGAELSLKGGTTQYGYVYVDNGGFRIINPQSGSSSGTLQFSTSNTERMRITSGGTVLLGTTSTSSFDGGMRANPTGTGGSMQVIISTTGGGTPFLLNTTADTNIINFYRSSTNVGTISVSTTNTAYNTSSDYRLKENIAPMTGALAKVTQLKPCTYTWKANGSAGQGFIAHELQAVVPDSVTGVKDAVDDEGNPVHQGVDTSYLVATLTAAIQELNAKVEAQAVRIAELEGAK